MTQLSTHSARTTDNAKQKPTRKRTEKHALRRTSNGAKKRRSDRAREAQNGPTGAPSTPKNRPRKGRFFATKNADDRPINTPRDADNARNTAKTRKIRTRRDTTRSTRPNSARARATRTHDTPKNASRPDALYGERHAKEPKTHDQQGPKNAAENAISVPHPLTPYSDALTSRLNAEECT